MHKLYVIILYLCLLHIIATADLVKPDYEIKLFIDSAKVLESGSDTLQIHIKNFFNVQEQRQIAMQFLDSHLREFYGQGWVTRIRAMETKSYLELSYKYRIPVSDTILAALQKAQELGWDSSEKKYEYQIDWGYDKQTLSITKSVELAQAVPIQLPLPTDARSLTFQNMPGKLEKWGLKYLGIEEWAEKILLSAHIYGPVYGKRYIGAWNTSEYGTIKVYIEVWNIAGQYITEVSCKTSEYQQAANLHSYLKKVLAEQEWLLQEDILKTKMILDAYSR